MTDPLCVRTCRKYTYTVVATAPGSLVNLVTLDKADNNATNNNASTPVTVLGICSNPFGNGTKLPCPQGSETNTSAANATFENADAFIPTCCVSVVLCVGVGHAIGASHSCRRAYTLGCSCSSPHSTFWPT